MQGISFPNRKEIVLNQELFKRHTDAYNKEAASKAAEIWVSEGLHHQRKDNIKDFARGDILLRIGNKSYTADVVVGTRENGSMLLYDVLNLHPASFTEKKTDAAITVNPLPGVGRNTASVSTNSISSTGENVNENFSLKADSQGRTLTEAQKDVTNENPTQDPDIRFSLKSPVEETKDLVALHNLTEDKLLKSIALGGFPMPSIAVTRQDIPHTNFGDITLVMDKGAIDPKASRKNTVYSADAWTPTVPRVEYEADPKAELGEKLDKHFRDSLHHVSYGMNELLNRYDGEAGVIEHAMENVITAQDRVMRAN